MWPNMMASHEESEMQQQTGSSTVNKPSSAACTRVQQLVSNQLCRTARYLTQLAASVCFLPVPVRLAPHI